MKISCLDINHRGWGHRDNSAVESKRVYLCGETAVDPVGEGAEAIPQVDCAARTVYRRERANKICQLYANDVQQVDKVWCLNIRNNRPDQQLKTANSARLIPIHSSLIAGGFMDFVQERAGVVVPRVTSSTRRRQPFLGAVVQSPASRRRSLPQPAAYRGNHVQGS